MFVKMLCKTILIGNYKLCICIQYSLRKIYTALMLMYTGEPTYVRYTMPITNIRIDLKRLRNLNIS